MAPVVGSTYPADESFRIWSAGQLGQQISGFGHPVAWSPDGRLLALISESATGGGGGLGGPIPGKLSVLKLPEKSLVLSRSLADVRLDVHFSPGGTRLATSDGEVMSLSGGSDKLLTGSAKGWTDAGALVVVGDDHRVSLWTPAGTAVVPNAYEWAVFGPNEGDVATLPAADENIIAPVTAVVRRAGGAVSVNLNVGLSMATWSSGGICFIATGTINAQLDDNRLLRIDLPVS